MKCTLVRFPTYVTGSSLAKIVKIESTRISSQSDVDRGSECEVRRPAKLDIEILSYLLHFLNETTWYFMT